MAYNTNGDLIKVVFVDFCVRARVVRKVCSDFARCCTSAIVVADFGRTFGVGVWGFLCARTEEDGAQIPNRIEFVLFVGAAAAERGKRKL